MGDDDHSRLETMLPGVECETLLRTRTYRCARLTYGACDAKKIPPQKNRIFTPKPQTPPPLRTYGVPRMWARPNATRPDPSRWLSSTATACVLCVPLWPTPPPPCLPGTGGKWVRNVHYTGLHTLAGRVPFPFTVTFPCALFPPFLLFF